MEAFGTVMIVIAVVAIVIGFLSYRGSGRIYEQIGRTGLALDEPELLPGPAPGSPAHDAEAQAEIRQMVEAKSARRVARGEQPLDVEAEIARLSPAAPTADPELLAELRQLVVAGNERRARRGQEPLDVEAEVQRRLREFGA